MHLALVEEGSKRMQVDVVLCTFNGERFLSAQLDSIERQSRRPDRVLVFDDGSTDGTLRILEGFRPRLPLAVTVNPVRLGPAANFSQALGLAIADVVFLCDQDDVWQPGKVQAILDLLSARPQVLLACSDARLIDATGTLMRGSLLARIDALSAPQLTAPQLFEALLRRNLVTGATCAVRRDLLAFALPVPEGFWHDEWLALVAAACDGVAWSDRMLTDYRLHDANTAGIEQIGWRATLSGIAIDEVAYQSAKAKRLAELAAALRRRVTVAKADRLAAVDAAAGHWLARANRPPWGRGRLSAVMTEFRRGGYRRFGAGWRSALRDLWPGSSASL